MQEFVWKQSEQDQLESLCLQMRRMYRLPYYRSARRRLMLGIMAICTAPVLVIELSNWADQNAISLIGSVSILGFLLYFLVIKEPGDRAIDHMAEKQAKRYMKSLDVVPTGAYVLRLRDDLIEWEWAEGGLMTSFPASTVIEIIDRGGYLHIVRPNHVIFTVPYHAFGDQETRERVLEQLRCSELMENAHE